MSSVGEATVPVRTPVSDIFATLIQMLNAGVHPIVPMGGSVGASDLTQMAAVGMVLIGRGDALYRGNLMTGGKALELAGIRPGRPQAGWCSKCCRWPARRC